MGARVFSMGHVSSHAVTRYITQQVNYSTERGTKMVKDALEQWLNQLELSLDQKILSRICLALAEDFDNKANTSTAAELRKTYLELKRSLGDQGAHDPLEAILKR
jgi:anti-sigma regulatory factor (Ser/Thr protein kinase)